MRRCISAGMRCAYLTALVSRSQQVQQCTVPAELFHLRAEGEALLIGRRGGIQSKETLNKAPPFCPTLFLPSFDLSLVFEDRGCPPHGFQ